MGLAASQARFLAITSRKANCEFRSMEIAQDKLSVTRELAKVSENYQNALNETDLVWDFDGSGQNMYNVSYGLLMTPTSLNNFTPYLITNRSGAVVLSGQMAIAAKEAISPDGDPGTKSAGGFAKFMEYLGKSGVVSESMVQSITEFTNHNYVDAAGNKYVNLSPADARNLGATLDVTNHKNAYNPAAGYGAEPLNKNAAFTSNIFGLAHRLEELKLGSIASYLNRCDEIYVNGSKANDSLKNSLTIADILTNEVIAIQIFEDGKHTLGNSYNVDGTTEVVGDINGLGLGENDTSGLYIDLVKELRNILVTDIVTQKAFSAADIATRGQFGDYKILSDKEVSEKNVKSSLKSTAAEYNRVIFYQNSKSDYNSGSAVNLTHLIGFMLTQFENCLNGYETYFAGPTYSGSTFVTDDPNYTFVMKDTTAVSSEVVMKADFYMQLYNNICSNGWTMSEKIDVDEEYLEQMLKNGNYFISSLSQDGYFYQGRYNEPDCILEVKDHDAIAQAEAEFTTLKAKLTYKEDRLDIEMKNLDAEISALTTEYDSVKGLISKNVEKVFQLFQ